MLVELVLLLILCSLLLFGSRRPKNFPPGPRGLPLLGYIPFMNRYDAEFPFKSMWKLSEFHGPVTGFYLGPSQAVISVCGYEACKEALTNADFSGRPDWAGIRARTYDENLGIMFTHGEFWRHQRRFTLRHLRDFGFGSTSMEELMMLEVVETMAEIRQLAERDSSGVVDFQGFFNVPILNLLWAIVAGHRFRRDDAEFKKLLNYLEGFMRAGNILRGNVSVPKFVYRVFPALRDYLGDRSDLMQPLVRFFEETVDHHRENRIENNPRDFIDVYLEEIERDQTASFTNKQLIGCIVDIFTAGAESTSNTIGFGILHLIHNPRVQARMQEELDAVCGSSLPNFSQRASLPYSEAVLMEIQRISSIAPLTVPHVAMKETQLQGYTIPEGSTLLINLYSVQHDASYWKDPHVFRPERFMDDNKCVKNDHLFPFGLGQRYCPGESLAKLSLFLFITALVKSFTFAAVPGQPLPDLKPRNGFTLGYRGFQSVVTPR